jgi:hypothetical protein
MLATVRQKLSCHRPRLLNYLVGRGEQHRRHFQPGRRSTVATIPEAMIPESVITFRRMNDHLPLESVITFDLNARVEFW